MLRISILTKGWEYFDIMHKDRLVARIYENGLANIYYSLCLIIYILRKMKILILD